MSKYVPFNKDFNIVASAKAFSDLILSVSVAASIGTLIFELSDIVQDKNQIIEFFNTLLCYFAILYFILDILSNYLFQIAETKRRNDFFDNGLNTQLEDSGSIDYFSNDNLKAGIFKLGVNCFENSYFTKYVVGRMLKQMLIYTIVVFLVILGITLFAKHQIVITVLQCALPFTVMQQLIRLLVFKNKIDGVFKEFCKIFSNATNPEEKEKLIIYNITNYEATLAWACIRLNGRIFKRKNIELSQKWEEVKRRYNISNPQIT